jgi:ribosomal protein S12 methylthiotransferase
MLAGLALDGFLVTTDPDGADVAVVNTCAFIDLARAESDQHLDELEALKRAGRLRRLVVAGCMAQRCGREVLRRHPLVDGVVGVSERDALPQVCRSVLASTACEQAVPPRAEKHRPAAARTGRASAGARNARPGKPAVARKSQGPAAAMVRVSAPLPAPPDDRERLRLTPHHYAYLRISEGCDNRCAYCAIPAIRGPLRSKPPDLVLAEAEELAADGARELILIGQDTTAYGHDFDKTRSGVGLARRGRSIADCGLRIADLKKGRGGSLARLLSEMRERLHVPWLRLMYTHPASFTGEVIRELAAGPPLVPYVDLPLQHISDPILASMGRRVRRRRIEDLIGGLRRAVPGIALRTSFIVGYPGETDKRFEELAGFVEKVRFDHVGVFVYSPEPGTRAAGLPDQVPAAVARQRWDRLMASAERLAHEAARQRIGQTLTVLVDGADESGRLVARHAGQAPEVDSVVLLPAGAAEVGAFADVRVTGAEGYDLVAEVISHR